MINTLNGGVNFTQLQQQGSDELKQIISRDEIPAGFEKIDYSYLPQQKQEIKPVKWCYRRKVGTYPKSWLSPAKKFLHFCFRFTHYRIEIIPRGRGKRTIFALQDNVYAPRYWQDLPLRHAKKVAVYLSIIRRRKYA